MSGCAVSMVRVLFALLEKFAPTEPFAFGDEVINVEPFKTIIAELFAAKQFHTYLPSGIFNTVNTDEVDIKVVFVLLSMIWFVAFPVLLRPTEIFLIASVPSGV